jgi:hypothetical protein
MDLKAKSDALFTSLVVGLVKVTGPDGSVWWTSPAVAATGWHAAHATAPKGK